MKSSDLVFVGIKGSVVALNRPPASKRGQPISKGSDFVNVVLQDGVIFASCYGEIFCLDPLTGNTLWHNPLKGFGIGLAIIATANATVLAAKHRNEQAAAAAATTAACSTTQG